MGCAREAFGNVALVNLGCRVNRVEIDMIARELEQAGAMLGSQRSADVVVINTCAVTGEAQAKTRKAIRHALGQPQAPLVVATGCVATLFADELRALDERVVVEPAKGKVAARVLECLTTRPARSDDAPLVTRPHGVSPTGRTRPGIKIQDGCNNRCTYCIVWKARGFSRSRDASEVIEEVREARSHGAHEVVLTGINLGNYRAVSADGTPYALPGLLERILGETGIERVRLSSIEPPDVTGELLCIMADSDGRIAPFLHVCLQSGCDRTLRQMGRVYDTDAYARVVDEARAALPDLALGTDLIVGFPGETDEDFERSLAFCERMSFAKMHVFRYSKRPGTPAAARDDQVPADLSAQRSARMLELAARMRREQAARCVNVEQQVLVQYPGRGVTGGLFDVLVDERHELDAMVTLTPHAVLDDGTLDARISSIICA